MFGNSAATKLEMQILNQARWRPYLIGAKREHSKNPLGELLKGGDDTVIECAVFESVAPYLFHINLKPGPAFTEATGRRNDDGDGNNAPIGALSDDVLAEVLLYFTDEDLARSIAPVCTRFRAVVGGASFLRAMAGTEFASRVLAVARALAATAAEDGITPGDRAAAEAAPHARALRLAGDLDNVCSALAPMVDRDPALKAMTSYSHHESDDGNGGGGGGAGGNGGNGGGRRRGSVRVQRFVVGLLRDVPDVVARMQVAVSALRAAASAGDIKRAARRVSAACDAVLPADADGDGGGGDNETLAVLLKAVLEFGNSLRDDAPTSGVAFDGLLRALDGLKSRFHDDYSALDEVALSVADALGNDGGDDGADGGGGGGGGPVWAAARLKALADRLGALAGPGLRPHRTLMSKLGSLRIQVEKQHGAVARCASHRAKAEAAAAAAAAARAAPDGDADVEALARSQARAERSAAFFAQMGGLLKLVTPRFVEAARLLDRASKRHKAAIAYLTGWDCLVKNMNKNNAAVAGLGDLVAAVADRVAHHGQGVARRARAVANTEHEKAAAEARKQRAAKAAAARRDERLRRRESGDGDAKGKAFAERQAALKARMRRDRGAEAAEARRAAVKSEIAAAAGAGVRKEGAAAALGALLQKRQQKPAGGGFTAGLRPVAPVAAAAAALPPAATTAAATSPQPPPPPPPPMPSAPAAGGGGDGSGDDDGGGGGGGEGSSSPRVRTKRLLWEPALTPPPPTVGSVWRDVAAAQAIAPVDGEALHTRRLLFSTGANVARSRAARAAGAREHFTQQHFRNEIASRRTRIQG